MLWAKMHLLTKIRCSLFILLALFFLFLLRTLFKEIMDHRLQASRRIKDNSYFISILDCSLRVIMTLCIVFRSLDYEVIYLRMKFHGIPPGLSKRLFFESLKLVKRNDIVLIYPRLTQTSGKIFPTPASFVMF